MGKAKREWVRRKVARGVAVRTVWPEAVGGGRARRKLRAEARRKSVDADEAVLAGEVPNDFGGSGRAGNRSGRGVSRSGEGGRTRWRGRGSGAGSEDGGGVGAERFVDFQPDAAVGGEEGVGPGADGAVEAQRVVVGDEKRLCRLVVEDVAAHLRLLGFQDVRRIGYDQIELWKSGRGIAQHVGLEEYRTGPLKLNPLAAGYGQRVVRDIASEDLRFGKGIGQGIGYAARPGAHIQNIVYRPLVIEQRIFVERTASRNQVIDNHRHHLLSLRPGNQHPFPDADA